MICSNTSLTHRCWSYIYPNKNKIEWHNVKDVITIHGLLLLWHDIANRPVWLSSIYLVNTFNNLLLGSFLHLLDLLLLFSAFFVPVVLLVFCPQMHTFSLLKYHCKNTLQFSVRSKTDCSLEKLLYFHGSEATDNNFDRWYLCLQENI